MVQHVYLLTIIGAELANPEAQPLRWIFWHDRDTILMIPNIPLEIFLPPEANFSYINLLLTRDKNGMNNGVFLVKVNHWDFKMFANALSIREYEPGLVLKYTEQSDMEGTIKRVSPRRLTIFPCQHLANVLDCSPGGSHLSHTSRNAGSAPSSVTRVTPYVNVFHPSRIFVDTLRFASRWAEA
jgi:hypothetical protein